MTLPTFLQNNLRLPIIAAPMFIVSCPDLVIAQCKAGIVGSFPALNARPQSMLEDWIIRIKDTLETYKKENPDKKIAPFAVNQICHYSNDRLQQDMDICVKHEVPIIITSLYPPSDIVQATHNYGGIVLHDVINLKHAQKAASQGVDGLILVSSGAGGHAGTLNPFAFVSEIKSWFNGIILLAGAISDGCSIAATQMIGADLAYIGSRFIATKEANASLEYKKALIDSLAHDIILSSIFTGIKGNYLKSSIIRAGLDPDNLPSQEGTEVNFGSEGNINIKIWKDIWGCGQGIGCIEYIDTVQSVVDTLEQQYKQSCEIFINMLSKREPLSSL